MQTLINGYKLLKITKTFYTKSLIYIFMKKVIIWFGHNFEMDTGETIKDIVEDITDGSIGFFDGPEILKITDKNGKILYNKPY